MWRMIKPLRNGKIRMIRIGPEIPAQQAAAIIADSQTYDAAGVLLNRTADQVRKLAWQLREAGYDCGLFRESGFKKKAVNAEG